MAIASADMLPAALPSVVPFADVQFEAQLEQHIAFAATGSALPAFLSHLQRLPSDTMLTAMLHSELLLPA